MRYRSLILMVGLLLGNAVSKAQAIHPGWSVAHAHSHNDYQQSAPFSLAYAAGFGSMEVDIFLSRDSLFVGHVESDIQRRRLLRALYLDSVRHHIKINGGNPYPDGSRRLQLLIDLKTEGVSTLAALIECLRSYPEIIGCRSLDIVITGNKPPVGTWTTYPSFIYFDGNHNESYPKDVLPKVKMISGPLNETIRWRGDADMSTADSSRISDIVNRVHSLGKSIRFYATPDNPKTWQTMMNLGVDWINTDHIRELRSFMGEQ